MLKLLHPMKGYKLAATDGEFGRVKDFLFDEEHWTVRYLVADTGRWIPRRKVLISPVSLGTPDWEAGCFPVNLTREQVEKQPNLDADAPVSRLHEKKWYEAYEYPYYYAAGSRLAWGYGVAPTALFGAQREDFDKEEARRVDEENCLRSCEEVCGYHVEATDGVIGKIEDMIMDDETWAVRYFMVNTRDWLSDRLVILAPNWIESFDWAKGKVFCRLPREAVEAAPAFNPDIPLTRDYEEKLYNHYGVAS